VDRRALGEFGHFVLASLRLTMCSVITRQTVRLQFVIESYREGVSRRTRTSERQNGVAAAAPVKPDDCPASCPTVCVSRPLCAFETPTAGIDLAAAAAASGLTASQPSRRRKHVCHLFVYAQAKSTHADEVLRGQKTYRRQNETNRICRQPERQ